MRRFKGPGDCSRKGWMVPWNVSVIWVGKQGWSGSLWKTVLGEYLKKNKFISSLLRAGIKGGILQVGGDEQYFQSILNMSISALQCQTVNLLEKLWRMRGYTLVKISLGLWLGKHIPAITPQVFCNRGRNTKANICTLRLCFRAEHTFATLCDHFKYLKGMRKGNETCPSHAR